MTKIVATDGGFYLIYPSGWATFCETREEAESLLPKAPKIYAGGYKFHQPSKMLRKSDGLYRTVCGQRGWAAGNTDRLTPCARCY